MPKILGVNSLAVLVGSIAFYFVGFIWYGVLFQDQWMSSQGFRASDFAGVNQTPYMVGGFLITAAQVVGLGLILKWRAAASPVEAVRAAALVWALIALPFAHYAYLYQPHHSPALLLIDASHLLVGWIAAALALSLLK